MRVNTYRIWTFVGLLATVGSFLVGLLSLMPAHLGDPGIPPGSQNPAGVCDTALYEPAAEQLRTKPKPAGIDRFLLLGADPRFFYYYDFTTGVVSCVLRRGPIKPMVEASRANAPDRIRQNGILVCVLVIVAAATGMMIIRSILAGRKRDKK